MAGRSQAAVAWECGVPEKFCLGSYQPKFRGPIKNRTYKFHGTPGAVKQCYLHYLKLKEQGLTDETLEPAKSKRE